jgi:hypothetical protein
MIPILFFLCIDEWLKQCAVWRWKRISLVGHWLVLDTDFTKISGISFSWEHLRMGRIPTFKKEKAKKVWRKPTVLNLLLVHTNHVHIRPLLILSPANPSACDLVCRPGVMAEELQGCITHDLLSASLLFKVQPKTRWTGCRPAIMQHSKAGAHHRYYGFKAGYVFALPHSENLILYLLLPEVLTLSIGVI